jgi:hypothetical protein
MRSIVKPNAIPRIDRHKRDVVLPLFVEQREQFIEQEMGGDNGGAGVEGVAVFVINPGSPTELGLFVEDGDVVTLCFEAKSSGDAAETGADDDGSLRSGHDLLQESGRTFNVQRSPYAL